jgi:integrase
VRVSRAIDRFLDQVQLEDDFTARSIESYGGVLFRLVDDPPRGFGPEAHIDDFEGRTGTEKLRSHIGHNWGATSTGRRANVISIHHSFWGWVFDEGFLDSDPSARIKRPPRRKAVVYRPPVVDVELAQRATLLTERAPWVLMRRVGLRAATVCATRWANIDLRLGLITVPVKGGHEIQLPLSPVALVELQDVYRQLAPDWDDHVFTVEVHRYVGNRRVVKVRDPKKPARPKALWAMVGRVCKRADVRPFGPHALRHVFATEYLRASRRDMAGLKGLLGHSSIVTTENYGETLRLEELADGLAEAFPVTSVAHLGDTDDIEDDLPLYAADGPGRNRTCEVSGPADVAEADRADAADEPRPNDGKERH